MIARTRGQAVLETVVSLPFFLLALAAVIFALRAAVVNERTQTSLRYAGQTLAFGSAISDMSGAAIYLHLAEPKASDPAPPCNAPTAISMTGSSDVAGRNSSALYQPTAGSFTPTCNHLGAAQLTDFYLYQSPAFSYGSLVLSRDYVTVQAGAGTSSFTGAKTISAGATFFRGPNAATLLRCYPRLRHALQATLGNAMNDTTTPTVLQPPYYTTHGQPGLPNPSIHLVGSALLPDPAWCAPLS